MLTSWEDEAREMFAHNLTATEIALRLGRRQGEVDRLLGTTPQRIVYGLPSPDRSEPARLAEYRARGSVEAARLRRLRAETDGGDAA